MAGLDKSGPDLPAHAGSGASAGQASTSLAPPCRIPAPVRPRRRGPRMPGCSPSAARPAQRPGRSRGFSLVEVLVVVAVLAVASGIAVVAVRGVGIERTLEREARRYADFARIACERAVATGREHGLHIADTRYGASLVRRGRWTLERTGALAPKALADGLRLRLYRDGVEVVPGAALDGDPALVCLPSGELTPFELVFAVVGGTAEERVRGRFDGRIERVEGPR